MKMGRNTKLLLVVVLLAMCVGRCMCWDEDSLEGVNSKDKTESYAEWAHQSLDFDEDGAKQTAQNMKNKAEDAASRATETMKSAASGIYSVL
ncbi:hypothetical protein Lal_00025848 [Lupinus albus]|nr:hypothetical protein Lal_00025848 [Lupinus albus]